MKSFKVLTKLCLLMIGAKSNIALAKYDLSMPGMIWALIVPHRTEVSLRKLIGQLRIDSKPPKVSLSIVPSA